jgi:hypothetical protein
MSLNSWFGVIGKFILRGSFSVFAFYSVQGQNSLDDLNIIYKHDFENNTVGKYNFAEWSQDWFSPAWENRQSSLEISRDVSDLLNPTKALQVYYPVNSLGPEEGGTNWWTTIEKQNEIYVSYDVMFMPGFQFQMGGKLPSVKGGSVEILGDFDRPSGYDGFAGGIMFKDEGDLVFYVYYADSKDAIYGESFAWGANYYPSDYFSPSSVVIEYGSGTPSICKPGEWHNLTYRMVLNTVKSSGGGNYDGILEGYFDGKLVTEISHLLFRHTNDLGIDCMRIVTFFGGSADEWRNPINEWVKIDNVLLFTFKDNMDVPRGNTLSPASRTIKYWRQLQYPVWKAPNPPTALKSVSKSNSGVLLKWTDNSDDEIYFELERTNPNNNGLQSTFITDANCTSFLDSNLEPNSTYNYRLRAYNSMEYSSYSNTIQIKTAEYKAHAYQISSGFTNCNSSDLFSVPLLKTAMDTLQDCIGFTLVMTYDKNKVTPTGRVQVDDALVADVSLIDYTVGIQDTAISISLYVNAGESPGARFNGFGQVMSIEFERTKNFSIGDTAWFTIQSLVEGYATTTKPCLAEPGFFSIFSDSSFIGTLRFWSDNNPLLYDRLNTDSILSTRIYGFDTVENRKSDIAVQPDLSGSFKYDILNGKSIQIERDVPDGTEMMPVINGIDAQMVRKVLVEDTSFIPNIYQIIAMDVNLDGVISAGDITQINERTMALEDEFQQARTYNSEGVSNGSPSKDWVFIPARMLGSNENFRISATYPRDDHKGFSRWRVPIVPNILALPVDEYSNCTQIGEEAYKAILLGDVDGNYKHLSNSSSLKNTGPTSADCVVLDLSSSIVYENTFDIPVSIQSEDPVYSLDLALKVNSERIRFQSVVNPKENLQCQAYFDDMDQTLRVTSNSLQPYDREKPLLYLKFSMKAGEVESSDISSANSYLNGDPDVLKVIGKIPGTRKENNINGLVKIFPNPANSFLSIKAPADASVQIFDITGSIACTTMILTDNGGYGVNVQGLQNGIYLVKIQYEDQTFVKKLIVSH